MRQFGNQVLILLLFVFRVISPGQSAQYNDGIQALKENHLDIAGNLFKESVSRYSDAPSLYELAKLFLAENTPLSRNSALEYFKLASLKEPKNIEYRRSYASLLEVMARKSAVTEYESMAEEFPDDPEPFNRIGKIMLDYFIEFKGSFMVTGAAMDLDLSKEVKKIYKDVEKNYLLALKRDSSNYNALIGLGKLYKCEGEYKKAKVFLERGIKIKPEDKTGHLLLGIAYNLAEMVGEAGREFNKALELMPASEREDYTYNSVIHLLEPKIKLEEKYKTKKERENYIERYWKRANPLLFENENQRLVEHYSRVAYSNIYFSIPLYNITGWKSDRGEVVLRYGMPRDKRRFRPYIGGAKPFFFNGKQIQTTANPNKATFHSKSDVWQYDGFAFSFDDYNNTGNSKLTKEQSTFNAGSQPNGKSIQGSFDTFTKMKTRTHTLYTPKGKQFNLVTRLYNFRSEMLNNYKGESYFVFGFPLPIIENKVNMNGASFEYSLTAWDSDMNMLLEKNGKGKGKKY